MAAKVRPSGNKKSESKATGAKAPAASVRKKKPEIVVEKWLLSSAPKGISNAGIFHGGFNERGHAKTVQIRMIDGVHTMDTSLSFEDQDELRISLMQSGFVRIGEPAIEPEPVKAPRTRKKKSEPEEPERIEEFGGGRSFESKLIPLTEAPDATYVCRHPDFDGGGPNATTYITIGNREVMVELKSGEVVTSDKQLRDYLVGVCGYTLFSTLPNTVNNKRERKRA